ncbi:MAG: hypothetical protein REH79_00250 [Spiroplasma sp.]|nr:hypothetical protein [Spiroplasma sp.]
MTTTKSNAKQKKSLITHLIWSGIIITSIGLIITVIDAAINIPHSEIGIPNPHNLWYPTGFWANIWNSLSTFTVQSNILVLVFFILALINRLTKTKLQFVNGWFKFAVTIYISITLIIFWAALFQPLITNTDFSKSLDVLNFLNTFLLHLFTPVIMIIFFFITSGTTKWAIKSTLTKALPIIISYMFIYLFYALIKGEFVGLLKNKKGFLFVDYSFPYFFLNVKEKLGTFFLYFFIILILFIGLFAVYYFYNNWRYDRKEGNQENKKIKATKPIN